MPLNNKTEWDLQLIDSRTMQAIDDDAGQCAALVAGTGRPVTTYTDDKGTAFTATVIHTSVPQPMTFTNGRLRFFTDNSVTSLDLSGITSNGHPFFVKGMVPSQHRHVIFPDAAHGGAFCLPYVCNTNTGVGSLVVDSGFDLPANVLVRDAYTDVLEVATGGALSVGTSTTVSGLLLAALNTVVATGHNLVAPAVTNYGPLVNQTATLRSLPVAYRRLNATSGARLVYANVTTTSTAGSGLVYLRLERLPTRGTAAVGA